MQRKNDVVAQATIKMAMISPRKLGLMADLMKKLKTTNKCVQQLSFHPRHKAAGIALKVLNSAVANAKQKNVYEEGLIVDVLVGKGKTLQAKPYFRGRGRVDRKQRYTSNICVLLIKEDTNG